MLIHCLGNF